MARYHLNAKGEPGPCKAMVQCPFGDLESAHYESVEEARAAYEAEQNTFQPFTGSRTLPVLDNRSQPIKAHTEVQLAFVEAMNDREFGHYVLELQNGSSPTGAQQFIEARRKRRLTGYQNSTDARRKAKNILNGLPATPVLRHVHRHEETMSTGKGNTYSKTTEQGDGRKVQTVNGVDIIINAKTRNGDYKIQAMDGTALGWLNQDAATRKWNIIYSDSTSGRPQKFPVDANAALLKKAGLVKPVVENPKTPTFAAGYEPIRSELDPYDDFPTNAKRTLSRLRQLDNEDLIAMFNRLEHSAHNGHYANETASDRSSMKRIEKVLAERGYDVEVDQYGKLQPGQDYGDANSYKLKEKA